jgi:hypothetical protein
MMGIPRELFILSAIMFTVLSVDMARKAMKEKSKLQYITLLLVVLGSVWSILAAFNQIGFAAIAWVAAMIISIINLPELGTHIDQQLLKVDVEDSFRINEILRGQQSGWLKLAYQHGIGYAVLGYFAYIIVIWGCILLALDYFFVLEMNLSVFALTFIPISTYRQYKQIMKRLAVQTKLTEQMQV